MWWFFKVSQLHQPAPLWKIIKYGKIWQKIKKSPLLSFTSTHFSMAPLREFETRVSGTAGIWKPVTGTRSSTTTNQAKSGSFEKMHGMPNYGGNSLLMQGVFTDNDRWVSTWSGHTVWVEKKVFWQFHITGGPLIARFFRSMRKPCYEKFVLWEELLIL